jgi:hypothetical protein
MKKIPSIIKKIQDFKPVAVDYAFQKSISYSQLSMFLSCPKKWALQYRDGHKIPSFSINMTFGTAVHETLQNYLSVMYNESGVKADAINIEEYFEERFRENYAKGYKDNKNVHYSSPKEMREFYEDGIAILDFIKKKRGDYFSIKEWHLVGIEVPIVMAPNKSHNNVLFNGFIDLVLFHEPTEKFVIYDIKTSGRGWSDKEKKDEVKQFQILLYKQYFSEQFGVDIENIDVEFFIVKRKIWEQSEYPQKRVQQFVPANGKTKVKKAKVALDTFVDEVFNLDGSYKSTDFQATPSKSSCLYCQYKSKKEFCDKAILK